MLNAVFVVAEREKERNRRNIKVANGKVQFSMSSVLAKEETKREIRS